jgi:WD40 repeat protein
LQEDSYKYWAFISYSHRDQAWADWVHHALETYHVPRRLVGRDSPCGPLPRRLYPVFRDQDELPSSPNLSGAIDLALRQSRTLIVIASPYAAVSRWVDQEIERFRALGRADRILCLIVDGEPHADRSPDKGQLECFPPGLRGSDGLEPIAADLRPGKDGKPAAKLKLIAGLLGVGLDELRRRERRRQQLARLGWGAAAAMLLALILGIWQYQRQERAAALAQQALQAHIDTVYEKGRQELLAHNQARAAVYLNEAYRLGVNTPALRFMLGRAMRVVEAQRLAFEAGAPLSMVRFSPDARRLITLGSDNVGRVWDVAGSAHQLFSFDYPAHATVAGPRVSRDNRLLYLYLAYFDAPSGELLVWDADSGRLLRRLEIAPLNTHTMNPFGPGGRSVAYVAPDRSARIAELATGKVTRRLPGNYSLAGFSRDGRRLLLGGEDGRVEVWDAAGARRLRSLDGLHSQVIIADDTEDGGVIAAGAKDGTIRAWGAADGALRILAGHPSTYPWLIFNLDGSRLFTGASDGVRVWSSGDGALVYALQSAANSGARFDISSDGRLLLLSNNSRLATQDIESGAELYTLDAHRGPAAARDISEDDRSFATGGPDGRVVLWNVPQMQTFEYRQAIDRLRWTRRWAPGVAAVYDHSGKRFASGGADGRLDLWDAGSHRLLWSQDADPLSVNLASFSDDDRFVLSGGETSGVKLWDAASGRLLRTFGCEGKEVLEARSGGGRYLAASTYKGPTCLWNLDGSLLQVFPAGSGEAPRFTADGSGLFLGGQGQVRLWDVAQGRAAWTAVLAAGEGHAGPAVADLDLGADGTQLLVASKGREAYVLDCASGAVRHRLSAPSASTLATARFDHAGRRAVIGDRSGITTIWSLADGRTWELRQHVGDVRSAEFSPDGAYVLTSGRDGTAKLWDASNGELLDTLSAHASSMPDPPFHSAMFDPAGPAVLTGSTDGVIRETELPGETRTPQRIAAILRCKVPWQLQGDEAAPALPAEAACRGESGGAP